MNDTPREPRSRTRPADPVIGVLRELRGNVRNFILTLEVNLAALEPLSASKPELVYLVTALKVAVGKRGQSLLGTPHGLERMLGQLLGEETTT